MRLRSGKEIKCHVSLETTILTDDQIKLNKLHEIHFPHIRNLLNMVANSLIQKEKAKIACDIYNYLYGILRDIYELKRLNKYNKFIQVILGKIPLLTQQCINQINDIQLKSKNSSVVTRNILVKDRSLYYEEIEPYLKCIEQLAKVQELANGLELK